MGENVNSTHIYLFILNYYFIFLLWIKFFCFAVFLWMSLPTCSERGLLGEKWQKNYNTGLLTTLLLLPCGQTDPSQSLSHTPAPADSCCSGYVAPEGTTEPGMSTHETGEGEAQQQKEQQQQQQHKTQVCNMQHIHNTRFLFILARLQLFMAV